MVQLILRAEKLIGERRFQGSFKKERELVSYLGNHQRRVVVLTLLEFFLDRGLILFVLLSLFDHLSCLSWECYLRVLLLEEGR